jgi:hypothetical protein
MKKFFSIVLIGLMMFTTSNSFAEKQNPQKHTAELVKQIDNHNDLQEKNNAEKVVIESVLQKGEKKDIASRASGVTIKCLQSATLPDYPGNTYFNACSSYNGHVYFTHLVYNNGQLTSSMTVETGSCSCAFD